MIIANAPRSTPYSPKFKVMVSGVAIAENLEINEAHKICEEQSEPALVIDQTDTDCKFMNHANTAYHEQFPVIQERDNYDEV